MHLLIGILVTVAAFWVSHRTQATFDALGGLLNPAALVLLAIGPVGVSLMSHPFAEWRRSLSVLVRAFRHDRAGSLFLASDEMQRIARAVRESRWQEAEDAVLGARSEHVRLLAPHVLDRLEKDALREAIATSSFRWMQEVKSADDLLQGLARFSPAFGMIGTIMGLVDLFRNMRDSSSLGPGMAMALLATLYGLILCYCLYMPLAQRVRAYLSEGAHEQRAIERALSLILDGRPVGDVRSAVLDGASSGAARLAVTEAEMESR